MHSNTTNTYAMCVYEHIYPTLTEIENTFCIVRFLNKTETILHSSGHDAIALFKIY